jgi:hypothetical protein
MMMEGRAMANLAIRNERKTVEAIRQTLAVHDNAAIALMRDATHHLERARDLSMKLQELERRTPRE